MYIAPFPLIITAFIIFPTCFHICPLGPHRDNFALPLAHILGWAWNDAPEVDAAEKKIKSIIGHIQQEDVPQNAKDGRDKHI